MMHRIFFSFIWIIGRVLLWIYRVDVKGLENLPKHSVLLCPNHSTDLDPVLIGLCLPLDYHLHFMAKAELFDNRALAWLIRTLGAFPVQRDGKDIQSIKTAMQVLHKGENLLIFPEGTTIRGGCSPLAGKKHYPVFVDESAILHERIYVSAGHRGVQLRLAPDDLLRAVEGTYAAIARY